MAKQAVIGIVAQVDAGKSTLAEAILLETGAIRSAGRVDHGDSHLDVGQTERARGITIKNKQVTVERNGVRLMFVDTPGHADFAAESERALQAADYVIFVVGAPDGMRGQATALWRLLRRYQVPTFVFVNKMDLVPDADAAVAGIAARLSGPAETSTSDASCAAVPYAALATEEGAELAASTDESAVEEFLETETLSQATLQRLVTECKLFPLFTGAALRGLGVAELLDGICSLTAEKTWPDEFAARVYGIGSDKRGERVAWVKVTGGSIAPRQEVAGVSAGRPFQGKVGQVRVQVVDRFELADSLPAGCVCGITGLKGLQAGDTLGAEPPSPKPLMLPAMAHTVSADGTDAATLYRSLRTMAEEDPLLSVVWDEETQTSQLRLMGEVQLEVVRTELEERFGIRAVFGPGRIPYLETVSAPVRGVGHFEPLRHYAEVHLLMEPLPRGAGVEFGTTCHEDALDRNWQRLILTNAMERQHRGVLAGGGLTDVRITLTAGRAHAKHTEGGDFRQATYRAIRQALMSAREQGECVLLEPWAEFELMVPADKVGRALGDLQAMAATFDIVDAGEKTGTAAGAGAGSADGDSALTTIIGRAPVVHLQGYATVLASYTGGQGLLIQGAVAYDACHNADEVIAQTAYDPRADLPHTPDSVFCAHGAGYTVPWNEAPAMAHVDPAETQQRPWVRADARFFAGA